MTDGQFRLSEELNEIHTSDVRGLAVMPVPNGAGVCMDVDEGSSQPANRVLLAASSRDMTATVSISGAGDGDGFSLLTTLTGHSDFVVPVCLFDSSVNPGYFGGSGNKPHVATGSRDKSVRVFEAQTGKQTDVLEGHEYQVTGIAVTKDGDILSASLDKTMRLWRNGSCIATIKGHEGPILCICQLECGDVVSGSGDTTIKKWIISKTGCVCEATWNGHTDTVRCLAPLSGGGVASGSHDMTLRIWSGSGDTVAELVGHTGIIYAVSALSSHGLLVSGSEDNTARVWDITSRACLQTIDHPGCVWTVCFLPSGDFATGCSDSAARTFTRAATRAASDEIACRFAEANVQYRESARGGSQADGSAASGLPGNVKLEDPSTLGAPGSKDGAIKLINENGVGIAYSWSMATGNWERIGEITDGPGDVSQGSQMHNGKKYDFVFDVDIGDGVPHRKLPFKYVLFGFIPHLMNRIERVQVPSSWAEEY